jgi:hypothetical protein
MTVRLARPYAQVLRFILTASVAYFAQGCRSTGSSAGLKDDDVANSGANPDCAGFDDAQGDPVQWLTHYENQADLEKIFSCAPASTSTPIGLGLGAGSVYQAWPVWNDLQKAVGHYIWGGKRLYQQADGQTCLLNQMDDNKTERYMAHVYLQPSNRDGKMVVVLDYRVDNTKGLGHTPAQLIVDKIVHGIRDEIREVTQNGQGTQVFIGRANVNKKAFVAGDLSHISDQDFADPAKYLFGANFVLDFRPNSVQAFGADTPACVPPATGG